MLIWVRGTRLLSYKTRRGGMSLSMFAASLAGDPSPSVPGLVIYLTGNAHGTPSALLHSLKHFKVLHQHIIILTVETGHLPRIDEANRVVFEQLDARFTRMTLHYSYAEQPDLMRSLGLFRHPDFKFDPMTVTFVLSRRTLRRCSERGLPAWQERLFTLVNAKRHRRDTQFPHTDGPCRRTRYPDRYLISQCCDHAPGMDIVRDRCPQVRYLRKLCAS